ncbi:hypothetical protein SK224_12075 [Microbacterium sp. BG28]|uniref:hypothetical protein n=1 Tax=Microbacterium sp. BG28 TaxID=3097356 RepID=UPI002A59B64B|nr:hypothetical protein [Microbacterium sp. BG28]MDY0829860.1 hypothetical protein [Microbacterium sp. BG28]
MLFGRKKREAEAELRRQIRPQVLAAGWEWEDAAPPPPLEVQEAVLRMTRPYGRIWTVGVSESVSGALRSHAFRAGRLVGYAYGTTNSGTPYGRLATAHAVWMSLPGTLPEIRLEDATLPARDDLGLRLPPIPIGVGGRWTVQGFIPSFATDLLTPEVVAWLDTAPPRCTVIIRAGLVIAYGADAFDAPSIATRAELLAGLIERVPTGAWNRADALVAGTGVFPVEAPDGAALRLDERLVARDWQGYGLQRIPWEDAPTAESSVVLRHRDAVDVWRADEAPTTSSPGVAVGFRLGHAASGGAVARPRIATVASTLASGGSVESWPSP